MAKKRLALSPVLSYPNRVTEVLREQINWQLTILRRIKAVLPDELAQRVQHCILSDSKLTVYTNSANWASQLRFFAETMLAAIEKAYPASMTRVVQIKIVEDLSIPKKTTSHNLTIPSPSVRHQILNLSVTTTDPQLKETFTKLHATLERLANQ